MQSLRIQFPDDACAALRKAPTEFDQVLRLLAAVNVVRDVGGFPEAG